MKTANDLKEGDTVGVLGWHREYGGAFEDDTTAYDIRLERVTKIELFPLPPNKTGMIKLITTSGGKSFKEVSKNQSIVVKDIFGQEKYTMFIDPADIQKEQDKQKQAKINELISEKEKIEEEINKLKA